MIFIYKEFLPEHGFRFPELILHNWYEFAPDKVIQKDDIEGVEYEDCTVFGVFDLKAKNMKR